MQRRHASINLSKPVLLEKSLEAYQLYLHDYLNDASIKFVLADAADRLRIRMYMKEETADSSVVIKSNRRVFLDVIADNNYLRFQDELELFKVMQLSFLDVRIDDLEESDDHKDVVKELVIRLRSFSKAFSNVPWTADNHYQYLCITDHYIQLVDQVLLNPRLSLQEIERSGKSLDKKLYGTAPLNSYLKAAIFGVMGALVGVALGIVIAGGSTVWAGGVGAIPGAILGAFKGAALGITIAEATSVSLLAATYGLYSGLKSRSQYELTQRMENRAIDYRIQADMVAINHNLKQNKR
ncbi:MAG: hypothetical protein P4M14_04180 [Gammaproteobacteria bacterium]|nr:hypothetical protein [Gammaproteobacteria bacterium]